MEQEELHSHLLESDLLYGGLEEEMVPHVLIQQDEPFEIGIVDLGGRKLDVEIPDSNQESAQEFYRDLQSGDPTKEANMLADWIEQQFVRNPTKVKIIREAQNAVLPPLLRHTSLVNQMLNLLKNSGGRKERHKVTTLPQKDLVHTWNHINKVLHTRILQILR